jgi:amino acid transporter
MIIGGVASVATWVIGPTKGLLVAACDGSTPPIFTRVNKHGSPVFILILQGVICTILSSVFLFMPTVSSSYWLLTAMTAQLAMFVYIAMFAAAIYLRYKQPKVERAYRIPGGQVGIWVLGSLGMLACVGAILLGFVPPAQIKVGSLFQYEAILISGVLLLCIPPFVIYNYKKPEWKHGYQLENTIPDDAELALEQ